MRACLTLAAAAFLAASSAQAENIVSEDHMIPSTTPGIGLFVRNKHLAQMPAASPARTLLFIHGATYPAETSFDLPIDGKSMMDMFAEAGFDVFLVDVRGYGRSTRPAQMDQPAKDNPPLATSDEAGADLGSAVDYILSTRKIAKLNLMGWSWGTSLTGRYTTTHNDKIERLVLYAPAWTFDPQFPPPKDPLPAYRLVDKDQAKQRWLKGVAEDQRDALIPPGVFDAWWNATLATDPEGAKTGKLRAPEGVIAEFTQNWMVGKPFYHPQGIKVPTLLIHAEWDADLPSYMAHKVFARLTNAPYKRFVELGQGTHTVMLEKNRKQFFDEILGFLTEKDPTALK